MAEEDRAHAEMAWLGVRLRDLRTGRDWTQDELARRAHLSKSYLSRIEDGDRQPSLASLLSLAQAFDVPLASLFTVPAAQMTDAEEAACVVLRAGTLPPQAGNGLKYTPLSRPEQAASMQPIRVVVPTGREDGEMYRHDGEEWLFVLSGTLRLALVGKAYTLYPGDTAHFDARVPHRLSALNGADAELILVACASPRALFGSYL